MFFLHTQDAGRPPTLGQTLPPAARPSPSRSTQPGTASHSPSIQKPNPRPDDPPSARAEPEPRSGQRRAARTATRPRQIPPLPHRSTAPAPRQPRQQLDPWPLATRPPQTTAAPHSRRQTQPHTPGPCTAIPPAPPHRPSGDTPPCVLAILGQRPS
ncbi:hypothetical protein BCR44DRAFT_279691 [Catenaria anguillulae PL171]|uniref:Uncharacterized protein n=1 Tax=Catenaria anguillulae PL171 TaxID=765915 RepID=A0A1Y2HN59_9FUNG|nr:hypothetical protein BCR44DRAFT_279691 [Catenaria anguillulae PL171]